MKNSFNILVPTDYSETSSAVLEYAMQISEQLSATIYLLHAYQFPVFPVEMSAQAIGIELQDIEDEAEAKMTALVKDLQQKYKNATICSLVNYGPVETMIDELVEDKKIDLLLLASKGGNATEALLFGSICADSIGKVKCPIIIVPKNYIIGEIRRIAYAASWIEDDDIKGIKNLLPLANAFKARITIVHIYSSTEHYTEADRHRYEAKLLEVVGYSNVEFNIIKSEDFNRSMEEYVKEDKIDLLVMVTHPRFLFEGLYHPSFTKKILWHLNTPLLVLYAGNL